MHEAQKRAANKKAERERKRKATADRKDRVKRRTASYLIADTLDLVHNLPIPAALKQVSANIFEAMIDSGVFQARLDESGRHGNVYVMIDDSGYSIDSLEDLAGVLAIQEDESEADAAG
jgi:hypothetical protein